MTDDGLLEREAELEGLRTRLAEARAGQGVLVFVEGLAGQGKTALLRALRVEAAQAGHEVLTAVGSELERDFPFGVVRQLFEGKLHSGESAGREVAFRGAAAAAEPVFSVAAASEDAATAPSLLHGLFWLCANLAEDAPLLLVVDDAHWIDAQSLRFFSILARRLEDLPVVLAIGARPADPGSEQELLDILATSPETHLIRLRELTVDGVRDLIERTLSSEPADAFVAACMEATQGNPLFVRELLRSLVELGATGGADDIESLRSEVPGSLSRSVVTRLRRLSEEALAMARAIAVLGQRSTLSHVAELAQIERETATREHVALARSGLVEREHLSFVHPLVRQAVLADLAGAPRADWHLRAARVLTQAGASDEIIAAHLLLTEPEGDPQAARALAAAGRKALNDGAPEVAARHLRRALLEPPAPEDLDAIHLAAGEAEARIGGEDAVELLQRVGQAADASLAVRAARLQAGVLVLRDRAAEAVSVLRATLPAARSLGPEIAQGVEDDLLDVLAHHHPLRAEYLKLLQAGEREGRPTSLSHLAFARGIRGAPAEEVLALARRALADASGNGAQGFTHHYALEALMLVEAADDAVAALRDAELLAARVGSHLAGPMAYMRTTRATWERAFGDLRHAEDEAREALDQMTVSGVTAGEVTTRSTLGCVLLDRGRIDEAADVLRLLPAVDAGPGLREMHGMRARLRHLQGRHAEALEDVEAELALQAGRGWVVSNREPTRMTQVRVLAALGRLDEAREIADAYVQVSQDRAVPGAEARARLVRAQLLIGDERLDELRSTAELAGRSPLLTARAEILTELGSALRREGQRVECRDILREAREAAHRSGATALEERAHEELIVAGARPRRVALSGVSGLTAAELRVAELAAQGLRNREIAEALFVTLKTVEVHLGRVYGKLDVGGRSQLATALAQR